MSLVEIRQIGRVAVMPTVEKVTVKGGSQSVATVVVISNNRAGPTRTARRKTAPPRCPGPYGASPRTTPRST